MANTRIEITFLELPDDGDYINIKANFRFPNTPQTADILLNFRTTPTSIFEVQIGTELEDQALKYYTRFLTVYGNVFDATVNGPTVIITLKQDAPYDYLVNPVISFMTAYTLIDTTEVLTVIGFDNNRYLINNEVVIYLQSGIPNNLYNVKVENLSNGSVANNLLVYGGPSSSTRVNLSPIIKSLFDYPADADGYVLNDQPTKNSNQYKISFSSANTTSVEYTKTFIRGGNRTNNTNQTLSVDEIARPVLKLPIWQGYETADYYVHSSGEIRKRLLAEVPEHNKDFKRTRKCNAVYLKFANQKGGYCNWMFESFSESESNSAQGSFIRNNLIDDLGSESSSKLKVFSKIPEYYIEYMNDLIVSPEVYANIDGEYVRVTMSNNTVTKDKIKRSYQVTLNINFEYRFNPTLLWSN